MLYFDTRQSSWCILSKAARDRECQILYPGCSSVTSTTALADYRLAGTCGIGFKPNDLQASWACAY
ncbi:nuclease domain-containing protein, partial [Pseudomonas syringae group genomosp. 7]|uniref:nuclease domain-containing protein n=1 Tax=Pseudomonas syringae group genomosp. 7 TaxID=251699 RepID=UPI00377075BF